MRTEYLGRYRHLLTTLARTKLIARSFIALLRYAYHDDGITGVFKNILVTIAHLDIVFMMTSSGTNTLLRFHPDLLNGSISDPYISTLFNNSRRARCDIVVFHYAYMASRISNTFYEQVANSTLRLWRAEIEDEMFSICIQFEKTHRREGDLTLSFETKRGTIYELSFTIVPGYLIGCSEPQVLLIGRVQGTKNGFDEIRRATKSCEKLARRGSGSAVDTPQRPYLSHEESSGSPNVAPPYLLVTAAQAIAFELDVRLVAGVNGSKQLSSMENYRFDYDSFWKSCSAKNNELNFYLFPTSFFERPFEQVSSDHRNRKRLRRQFKSTIHQSVRAAFAEKCLTPDSTMAGDRLGNDGSSATIRQKGPAARA
jgi:uncharacterized protein VirK/YbjX